MLSAICTYRNVFNLLIKLSFDTQKYEQRLNSPHGGRRKLGGLSWQLCSTFVFDCFEFLIASLEKFNVPKRIFWNTFTHFVLISVCQTQFPRKMNIILYKIYLKRWVADWTLYSFEKVTHIICPLQRRGYDQWP